MNYITDKYLVMYEDEQTLVLKVPGNIKFEGVGKTKNEWFVIESNSSRDNFAKSTPTVGLPTTCTYSFSTGVLIASFITSVDQKHPTSSTFAFISVIFASHSPLRRLNAKAYDLYLKSFESKKALKISETLLKWSIFINVFHK